MTRSLRSLAAALTLALLPLAPAHAADSQYTGTCSFDTFSQQDVTGPDVYTGFAYATTVVYSRTHGNVVNATVTCEVRVNDVVQTSLSASGSGVVLVAGPVTFTASDVDHVELCTVVDYTSDDTPTATYCPQPTTLEMPPNRYAKLINGLLDWLFAGMVTYVDPALCAALGSLAPGVPPVMIDPSGDVYLDGELFWDCPPYDYPAPEPWPPGVPPLPPLPEHTEPFVPTGGGFNTGDAGFLLLTDPENREVATACGYVTDPASGTITVVGSTATAGASSATVHCRLTDAGTGAVLYDRAVPADAPFATLHDTVPPHDGPVTVCTEGSGTWAGARSVTVGPHCRPGEAVVAR